MNNNLTPEERAQLVVLREAIEMVFDFGEWRTIDDQMYWTIPQEIAYLVDKMICDMEEE